jgi:hypothetical protein
MITSRTVHDLIHDGDQWKWQVTEVTTYDSGSASEHTSCYRTDKYGDGLQRRRYDENWWHTVKGDCQWSLSGLTVAQARARIAAMAGVRVADLPAMDGESR